ncbi:MAG: protein translocase subunit SecD, partial [Oscillospiraceae bacterium]
MKKVTKPIFFIVLFVLGFFTLSQVFGIKTQYGDVTTTYVKSAADIRWGIDIRGGVDVTFTPPDGFDASDSQMDSAKEVITQRLLTLGIADSDCYVDYNKDRIIVRFPWKEGETNFNPEEAVKELGETAALTFREGHEIDEEGLPTGVTKDNIILEGKDIVKAAPVVGEDNEYMVSLELSKAGEESGAKKFADATTKLAASGGMISIWMDDTCISYPNVNEPILDGKATISGQFDA